MPVLLDGVRYLRLHVLVSKVVPGTLLTLKIRGCRVFERLKEDVSSIEFNALQLTFKGYVLLRTLV
jgi:hypothetical protein